MPADRPIELKTNTKTCTMPADRPIELKTNTKTCTMPADRPIELKTNTKMLHNACWSPNWTKNQHQNVAQCLLIAQPTCSVSSARGPMVNLLLTSNGRCWSRSSGRPFTWTAATSTWHCSQRDVGLPSDTVVARDVPTQQGAPNVTTLGAVSRDDLRGVE